ncbi:MAG: hypothetical protein JW810_12280 [Sedimentisphaerales bacterium]|nr:hypothetical protein [Sedimentisphaerales bacterium]
MLLSIRRVLRTAVCLALLLSLTGCFSPGPPPASDNPLTIQADPVRIWTACRQELKNRGFELQQVDLRSGRIETLPRTSSQWFEPGCQDVVTTDDFWESNLHTIRRKVTLVVQSIDSDRHRVGCRVQVERLAAEPDIISGQVRVRNIFGSAIGRAPAISLSDKPRRQQPQWNSLGRDEALEGHILLAIQKAMEPGRSS